MSAVPTQPLKDLADKWEKRAEQTESLAERASGGRQVNAEMESGLRNQAETWRAAASELRSLIEGEGS